MKDIFLGLFSCKTVAEDRRHTLDHLDVVNDRNDKRHAKALKLAAKRHGKPFAVDKGSTWKPSNTPVLTAWMQESSK